MPGITIISVLLHFGHILSEILRGGVTPPVIMQAKLEKSARMGVWRICNDEEGLDRAVAGAVHDAGRGRAGP